ncbi:MAG: single-stranded-DNA-specific exonuclease RecJ [Candidatus Zambryskibacteria bacterium RIFCSPLOWO2_02_FULL_51_21]|uniref:Single-stranded-DNA-specific exonuclease RecJ n=1 Tax=Candidatus Zambryskibacteria bacterium RIFCSPHIGHO2_02_FULL_43_37 TaxID=1802749 RepID=A0A1G2TH54_9BACT|nr:MAG: single-stranded-DNA-specific exonuclease RecJ [Candidatus Zambryskibacteria bacterium RIFCSPHIGHO2_01_FULL_52_18]OHA96388.1 MAG: single-stranded-DNA-specific exonuclease RecJ [Candidatus Zambryskibacteria bacterium RIFCSPHIGHO2_02_FULL_43_37]OHB07787.1 MAG: single-stranded-DNA-specific exonuclease RecJ [Candidatus Zambryskibacteria bacterium RIFCSPLOWO2_01_FULL_52_12]OHB11352.1 MAG: single-stranded-DNA-specific exonuclease RecJ [Candidatus Zambryskibacteria bacterium RIFCSPLOWO2_02_FULL_
MSYPDLLETLLKQRGVEPGESEAYLKPDYGKLYDPLLLPDMEKARDRVIEAIKNSEKITIFSDYDADGIPGAVVLSDFFSRAGYKNVSFYIPHRHDEGFGLNTSAVAECAEKGTNLIVTVDCGTADAAEVKRANELGMDVIVTDHHEASLMPEAYAVVNPKRAGSKYPFKELCGAAIAFKLVQAILAKENFGIKEGMEKWSLDMVGIATLSDMVPLVGENRIFARFGLDVLRKSPRPGLAALLNNLNLDRKTLSEDDIAFMITPRINAASRMGVSYDAFKLLSTTDAAEAQILADHLEKINNERKGVVASMVKEAKKHLKSRENLPAVLVIGSPEWKPSLVGLVANALVEEYERPVFVWARDGEGMLKGSCRSYNGYDLFQLMERAAPNFIEFGGHAGAGGFSVELEKLPKLEEKLSEALAGLSCDEISEKSGFPISLSDVSENLWQTVAQFAPFGTGNEKPVFKIKNAPIKSVRQFGKEANHLELGLGNGVKAISFFSSPSTYNLEPSPSSCTLYGTLEKSYFRSRPELRLRIVNIEL